jgi:DNA-directed RNA polymerase subunit RPC12/RpoP
LDDDSEWEDDNIDDDFGDASADEDEELTVACPYCREQIHEDSVRCPYCGQYLSEEDAPASSKSWLVIVGALACLYVVYRWIVG